MDLVVTILGLSALVIVHELGHFLAARAVGMRVVKFSIGFGPSIVRYQGKDTVYQLAAFPIGGYVQVDGLGGGSEGDEFAAIVDRKSGEWTDRRYEARPLWQRTVFVAAGSTFNFLFAWVVCFGLYASSTATTIGFKHDATMIIQTVKPDTPAATAGLMPGDIVERIDGERVERFSALRRAVGESGGQAIELTIVRPPAGAEVPYEWRDIGDDGLRAAVFRPEADWPRRVISVSPARTDKGFQIGIQPRVRNFSADGLASAAMLGGAEAWAVAELIFDGIGKLFQGSDEVQLGSVVKMAEVGTDQVAKGGAWFLMFLVFISINLGLLNLLPIPGLDGGRLMFIGIEAVARRPVPPKFEMLVHAVGLLFLFGLVGFVLFRDIADVFF